jgi:uncharacterized protein YbjT (DUF2867 family)
MTASQSIHAIGVPSLMQAAVSAWQVKSSRWRKVPWPMISPAAASSGEGAAPRRARRARAARLLRRRRRALASFEDAEQVLLVSSSDPAADQVSLHRVGVETAVTAGARRILYTSHQGAGLDSPFRPARVHAATEELLADSGVAWTSLRNGFYADTLDWLLGPWRETGIIAAPADGPVSWTDRGDEAEAAAVILAGRHPGVHGAVHARHLHSRPRGAFRGH